MWRSAWRLSDLCAGRQAVVEAGGGAADALAYLPTAEYEILQREVAAIHRYALLLSRTSIAPSLAVLVELVGILAQGIQQTL